MIILNYHPTGQTLFTTFSLLWTKDVGKGSLDCDLYFYPNSNHRQFSGPRSCVKVEVAVQGSPSLTVLMVSVDVKQH